MEKEYAFIRRTMHRSNRSRRPLIISLTDLQAKEGFSDRHVVAELLPDVQYFGSEDDYV